MLDLARANKGDQVAGEQTLIGWYSEQDRLWGPSRRATGHPDLRPRRAHFALAVEDHKAGRYCAVVQTLLSVMDGFVNDVDKAKRRGLHAREPGEIQAWDSVVGHHLGLTSAHRSFVRSFSLKREVMNPSTTCSGMGRARNSRARHHQHPLARLRRHRPAGKSAASTQTCSWTRRGQSRDTARSLFAHR